MESQVIKQQKNNVLVVDDDPAIQILVRECLERENDFFLHSCATGEEALQILNEQPINIVLLDINMPGIDGIETCYQIRAREDLEMLPILMMTGLDDIDSVNKSYQAGATDFITKPINWPLLAHHVRYMLRAGRALIEHEQHHNLQTLNLKLAELAEEHFNDLESILQKAMQRIQESRLFNSTRSRLTVLLNEHQDDECRVIVYSSHDSQSWQHTLPLGDCASITAYLDEQQLFYQELVVADEKIGVICLESDRLDEIQPFFQAVCDKFSQLIERVTSSQELFLAASYFANSLEGIVITDENAHILRINKAFTKITGFQEKDVLQKKMSILQSGRHKKSFYASLWATLLSEGHWQGEIWNKHFDGHVYPQWLSIVRITQFSKTLFMGVFVDISKQKQQEQYIQHLAYFDELTGIANRTLFFDHLDLAIQQSQQNHNHLATLLIDLDRFKRINDSLGQRSGDHLLNQVAYKLKSLTEPGNTIARLNGDEFILLLSNLSPNYQEAESAAKTAAEKILATLAEPIEIGNTELLISCSIGISLYPDQTHQSSELVKFANLSMQKSKANGGKNYTFFEPSMLDQEIKRFNIENALQKALNNDEFSLFFQPQMDHRGLIIGAECLIRWHREDRGWISPAEFIPIAEESGIIFDIGNWVLETACANLKDWESRSLMSDDSFHYLAVNISPKQFNHENFIAELDKIVFASGLKNLNRLELELTESCLMQNTQIIKAMIMQLHHMGIRISIDDFGTGYSSLAYLNEFTIDTLKIDQSFVRECLNNPKNAAIVETIIVMAKNMQLNTIAEGVETQEQLQFLKAKNCNFFQGYYFAKPLELPDFERFLINTNQFGAKQIVG